MIFYYSFLNMVYGWSSLVIYCLLNKEEFLERSLEYCLKR